MSAANEERTEERSADRLGGKTVDMSGAIRIGISGWTYPGWRGAFYPAGLAHRKELAYAAGRLSSIEINGSFYSLQRPSSYAKWYDETPSDFVFAVKGGRFITHMKKLADVDVPLANFFASGVLRLGEKFGPVLWQLPPTLGFDAGRLERFFDRLPRTHGDAATLASMHDERIDAETAVVTTDIPDRPIRHALEVRHTSFNAAEFPEVLRRHDVALVLADTAGKWPLIDQATSDFAYLRLHGDKELYTSGYSDAALDRWAERIRAHTDAGRDAYVYFDNDVKVRAPYDAMSLAERLGQSPVRD